MATKALLSASTISGFANESSSILEPVDLDLIEQIIERAPRSATSFPLVYRAYGEVLEDHGLSPSSDTAYYQFLLKLGVIRAPTWGEKWDLYKATHSINSRSTVSPRKVREIHTRARVPFLATASSDLDYGFADGDSEEEATESVLALRFSPVTPDQTSRSDASRSLVGYTPSRTLDYDALSSNAPIRTSTPVYAQEKGYTVRGDSPPLPPYSLDDISDSLVPSDSLSAREDQSDTPKLGFAVLVDEKAWTAHEEVEMEHRADAFYVTGLLGRCWDVWHQAHTWVEQTTAQIDSVRDTILLRQALLHWRAIYDRALNNAATADNHRAYHDQARFLQHWLDRVKEKHRQRNEGDFVAQYEDKMLVRSFKRWRLHVNERRTKRWEKDMAQRERQFVKARDESASAAVFEVWYNKTRDRVDNAMADEVYQRNELRKVFMLWLKRTVLDRQLESRMGNKDFTLLSETFSVWKKNASLLSRERETVRMKEGVLLARAWDHWRLVRTRQHQANMSNDERTLRHALGRWKKASLKYKHLSAQACEIDRQALLKKHMSIWMQRERCALYTKVRAIRLVNQSWIIWQKAMQRREDLAEAAATLSERYDSACLRRSLQRWRAKLALHDNLRLEAQQAHETLELKRRDFSFEKWLGASRKVRTDEIAADKACDFFLLRAGMKTWKMAMVRRKQAHLVERRRLEDLKVAFDTWKDNLRQKRAEDMLIDDLHSRNDERLARIVIRHWTARVVDIKLKDHSVINERNSGLKRDAMGRWVAAMRKVQKSRGLMDSFIDVRSQELVADVFAAWRTQTVRSKELRIQLEQSLLNRDEDLLTDAFATWKGRLKERRLEPTRKRVEEIVEDGLMFAVWDNWTSRTTKLPYLAFTKRRALKMAWERWRKAMDVVAREKSFTIPREQELLADVFAVWREATAVKLDASSKRRRGRIRPTGQGAPSQGITPTRRVTLNLPDSDRTVRPSSSLSSGSMHDQKHFGVGSVLAAGVQHVGPGRPSRPRISSGTDGSDLVRQLRSTLANR